jgi:hypothetical protein
MKGKKSNNFGESILTFEKRTFIFVQFFDPKIFYAKSIPCDHILKLWCGYRKNNFGSMMINFILKYLEIFFYGNNMETLGNEKLQKSCNEFLCIFCNYNTCRKSSYDKHIMTFKHLKVAKETEKLQNDTEKLQKVAKSCNEPIFTCDFCCKDFLNRSGLWKHKKIFHSNYIDHTINTSQSNTQITTELVMELIKDNKEMKQIIMEQHNTINNLVKNGITNNINTNTNCMNNNKTFNLQFFLNETCKDAMNITDFVESIKVQLCDLENLGEVGYIEGISNIITTNLKALDITERPVHCTDKKRETIYIKDDNKWEKEDEKKSRLRKAIKKIANKNYKLLPAYREKYPGCQYSESKYSDKYNKMVIEALGGEGDNDAEKEDKIIRNITKVAVIQKE